MRKRRVIAGAKAEQFYKTLLCMYPEIYRKRFGNEMLFVFQDLYQEESVNHGKADILFWFAIVTDTIKSAMLQHIILIQKHGIKNYFHINIYNIMGAVFLLPFLMLFCIDFFSRLIQGDFTHYNRVTYNYISHTMLYNTYNGHAPLLWTVLILAPCLAVVINCVPVFASVIQRKIKSTIKTLFLANPLAFVIIAIGAFCLLVVYGHDSIPCVMNRIYNHGFGNVGHMVSFCRNA
ncbi:MAG TPA: hypothetical protein VGT05_01145 [Patescibacteria group bacterium]|nr:hypothetical protein [Patescibacteria group bacterium]